MMELDFTPVVKHVIIDEQGNETEISAESWGDGLIQDKEYSDTPEGN